MTARTTPEDDATRSDAATATVASSPGAASAARVPAKAVDNRSTCASARHDRGMLRLDPAYPAAVAIATTLQFGADPVAVIDDPTPWQQRLVRELERGIPDAALGPDRDGARRARRARPRIRAPHRACARPRRRAARRGSRCRAAQAVRASASTLVAESLGAAGFDVSLITWFGRSGGTSGRERPRGRARPPRRRSRGAPPRSWAATSRTCRSCSPARAPRSDPSCVPGRTPCLACLAAHRRDADPAWPLLAAQLLGRPAPAASRGDAMGGGDRRPRG